MGQTYTFTTIIFLCNHFIIGYGISEYIDLYTDINHKGNRTQADVSECTNLPAEMLDKVSAADTQGYCAVFYADKDCGGVSIEMLARSPSHHDFRFWGFDDKTASVGLCREQCSVDVTGPVPTEPVKVDLYERPAFKGAKVTLPVKGCTLIPRKMNNRILSVNTTGTGEGHCWQLYNNIDCKTNLTGGQDSIELRMGTPFHHDLRHWLIHEIKAISNCSLKCSKDEAKQEKVEVTGDTVLFDGRNYKGIALGLQKKDGEDCINLDKFTGWEGATGSLKFEKVENNCLTLFGDLDCRGDLQLKLNSSQAELVTKKFDGVARSLQFCDPN